MRVPGFDPQPYRNSPQDQSEIMMIVGTMTFVRPNPLAMLSEEWGDMVAC